MMVWVVFAFIVLVQWCSGFVGFFHGAHDCYRLAVGGQGPPFHTLDVRQCGHFQPMEHRVTPTRTPCLQGSVSPRILMVSNSCR